MTLKALIFDLDGVITDTAEYHFLAWQRLANELNITFTREDNEQLRGVPRRESLLFILGLGEHTATENEIVDMMARKNRYYVAMLENVSPADMLPGVPPLLDALDDAGIQYCIGSASRNSPNVVQKLGLADRMQLVAHGGSVPNQKPAPDLFRYAAAQMGFRPDECIVVEDAAAGVSAALAGGIAALALGPAERFGRLLDLSDHVTRRDDLTGLEIADLGALLVDDAAWTVVAPAYSAETQSQLATTFTIGNGYLYTRGTVEEGDPDNPPFTGAADLTALPNWLDTTILVNGHPFRLNTGDVHHCRRRLDLRRGILHRTVRWVAPSGHVLDLTFERFLSYAHDQIGALRLVATAVNQPCDIVIQSGIDGHVSAGEGRPWRLGAQGQTENALWLEAETRSGDTQLACAASVTASAETRHINHPGAPQIQTAKMLEPGQSVQIDKRVSYAISPKSEHTRPLRDEALAALDGRTYDATKEAHIAAWRDAWREAERVIEKNRDSNDAMQLAQRTQIFHQLATHRATA